MPNGKERLCSVLKAMFSLPVPFTFNPSILIPRQSKQVKDGSDCFVSD
nr:MAG TPA_asm: hypothetical protein [Bacteriophage sp.]